MNMTKLRYFVTVVVLVLALNVHAQDEDEDVAYSLNLAETVVLADGTTFEEYLLKQVLANAKPLKERVRALRYSVTCQLEKDIDLTTFPHRRTITFAARLAGYGQIVYYDVEREDGGNETAADTKADCAVPEARRYDECQCL